MQEHFYTNPENPARRWANFARISLLAGLAGGAIAIAAPTAAKGRPELGVLIDQADALSLQIDIASDRFLALLEMTARTVLDVTLAEQRLDALCEQHVLIEEKIWFFPCSDFAAVARKIAYLDRTMTDQMVFNSEWAMGVIWSLGGLQPKSYGPIEVQARRTGSQGNIRQP